jgi:hypothetical protein
MFQIKGLQINKSICQIPMFVLLHVWGSLGSITLALLQQWDSTTLLRFLRYATILGGLSFIVIQQFNQQHCYASDNRHRDVTMVFGILLTSECVLEFTRVQTCIWLRTPFGWKIKFVSGTCERSTWVYTVDGEDIRSSVLVNGRLMMDYTPRCHCGVQVDR